MKAAGQDPRGVRPRGRCFSLLVVLAVATAVSAPAAVSAQSLQESWLQVQQGLSSPETTELESRITNLEDTAAGLYVLRSTPFAAALVGWAEAHPDWDVKGVLGHARKLDPKLPSSYFLAARLEWARGAYFSAFGSYLAGVWKLVGFEGSAKVIGSSALATLLISLACSLVVIGLVQTAVYLRQLGHDALELGGALFQRANAVIFAIVILVLPLFAGFGPVWLLAYLYAMTWSYMKRLTERAFAIATLVLLGAVPLGLELWQGWALSTPPLSQRIGAMLADRRIDYAALREFVDLEPELGRSGRYHLLLGELFRMHGHPERARSAFQKASLANVGADPHVGLGSLALEDGNIQQAIQHYTAALNADSRSGLSYLNLSFAFDQSRQFVQGDQMREKAREILGNRPTAAGIPGRDERIRFPELGEATVAALIRDVEEPQRVGFSGGKRRLRIASALTSPFCLAMWVNLVIGVAVLFARRRFLWESSSCTRCGKVFCPRCKSSTESMSYCSQCISVFLKRDLVSIEQQTAKMKQVRRWEASSTVFRRTVGIILPGSHFVFSGKAVIGFLVNLAVTLLLMVVVVSLPLFLPSAEPLAQPLPLQIVLGTVGLLMWARLAVVAWYRR